ncbi:trypsin-like peptidase domain-containing protein [Candidatus Liberibacter americanus]|uniref:Serine protease DO-like protease n=1 Tax=Candidatus Liberibacter americanus str. Sao Paulo TaxID=1261131 RepID=U6B3I4_9HYPH|nr:trypsin-like peptidase domain-containing protein [Candidatus Liberibacter americanus]AHA27624.1 serine protease DO-like protease [Candidatus Liberibacter americanus str. Sao Paulo]EMS36333.1 serine protease DO-like protease [Candidatus Liberibacter americanus PW_SP]
MLKIQNLPIIIFSLVAVLIFSVFGGSIRSVVEARDASYVDISPVVDRVASSVVTVVVKIKKSNNIGVIGSAQYQNLPSLVLSKFPHISDYISGKDVKDVIIGSGFFISTDGYVVTNSHVVKNGADIAGIDVVLKGGAILPAYLVGYDHITDLAVLKVKSDGKFNSVKFGDTDSVRIGERVFAIGSPLGISETVTSGIVSARGRSDFPTNKYGASYLQIDAPLTIGNSGGPCFNSNGLLVGINYYGFNVSGIGFAISTSVIKEVIPSLIKNGRFIRGWSGISIQNLTKDLAVSFGIPDKTGVVVFSVTKDSPADKIGLKIGDVICELNGKPISNLMSFIKNINLYLPKDKIEISLCSEKGKRSVSLVLEASPKDTLVLESKRMTDIKELLGIKMKDVIYEDGRKVVRIVDVNLSSDAYFKGALPGMYISYINSSPVSSTDDVKRLIYEAKSKKNKSVSILLQTSPDRDDKLNNKTWIDKDGFIDVDID